MLNVPIYGSLDWMWIKA